MKKRFRYVIGFILAFAGMLLINGAFHLLNMPNDITVLLGLGILLSLFLFGPLVWNTLLRRLQ